MDISTTIYRLIRLNLFICLLLVFSGAVKAQNETIAGQDLDAFDDNIFSNEDAVSFSQFDFSTTDSFVAEQLTVYTNVNTPPTIKMLQDDGSGNFTEIGEFVFDAGEDVKLRGIVGEGTNIDVHTSVWTINLTILAAGDYRITGEFYRPNAQGEQYHLTGSFPSGSNLTTIAGTDQLADPSSNDLFSVNMSYENIKFRVNTFFNPEELILIQKTNSTGSIQLKRKVGEDYINETLFVFDRVISPSNNIINIFNTAENVLLQKNAYKSDAQRILPPGEYLLDAVGYQALENLSDLSGYKYMLLDDNDFFDLKGIALGPVENFIERGALFGDITFKVPLGSLLNTSHIQGNVALSYKNLDNEWVLFANVIESVEDLSGGNIKHLYYDGGRGGRHYMLELLDPEIHYSYSLFTGREGINYLSLSIYKDDFNNQALTIYHRPPVNSQGEPCNLGMGGFGSNDDRGDCFPRRDSIIVEDNGRLLFSSPYRIEENPIDGTPYLSILGDNGIVNGNVGPFYRYPNDLSTTVLFPSSQQFDQFADILRPTLGRYVASENTGSYNNSIFLDKRRPEDFIAQFIGSPTLLENQKINIEARVTNEISQWSSKSAIEASTLIEQFYRVVGEFTNVPYEFRWIASGQLSNRTYSGPRSSNSTFDMHVSTHAAGLAINPITFENDAGNRFAINDYTISNSACDETIALSFTLDGNDANARQRNHHLYIYRQEMGVDNALQPYDTLLYNTGLPYQVNWTDENTSEGIEYAYSIVSRINHNNAYFPVIQSDTLSAIASLPTQVPTNLEATSTAMANERYIDLSWTHSDIRNTGFLLYKRWEVDGVPAEVTIDIDGDVFEYRDEDLNDCAEYTYKVGSVSNCQPDGEFSETDSVIVVAEPFLKEIVSQDILSASKGYFSNSVQLGWTYNDESPVLQRVKIYKRELGDNVVPALTTTLNAQELSYIDQEVENNVYYEYFLVVEGTCQGDQFDSYDIRQIEGLNLPNELPAFGVAYNVGFKSSSAVITGNISYEGGIGVPDVRVAVDRERDSNGELVKAQAGSSLYFDGTDQDTARIETSTYLTLQSDLTLMAWISPQDTLRAEQTLLYQSDAYELLLRASTVVFRAKESDGTWHEADTHVQFDFGKFTHITASIGADSMALYINGSAADVVNLTSFSFHTAANDITLGYKTENDHYHGYLDELRIYRVQLNANTVLRDYQRTISSTTEGLAAYWRLDEGLGGFAYDVARTGNVFHQNDFRLNGAEWSSTVPTVEQLAVAAYTNQSGNYVIEGITFHGIGENLTVSPRITLNGAIHEFSPQERGLFVGEGNLINNNIDFIDISAFQVSGQAFYAFETVDGDSTIGVEGATFLLNGTTPLFNSNNELVSTDEQGLFTISVPIGNHYIQIRKDGHVFDDNGKFPATGTFDFQDDLAGIVFYDTTKLSLKGKVVGGLREGDKKLGDPTTKNNIGQSSFILQYPAGENPRLEVEVTTNSDNGEYDVLLPPLPFFVKNNEISYTKTNQGNVPFAESFESVDMSNKFFTQYDTIHYFIEGELDRVDSTAYNHRKDYIYRITPNILVTNTEGLNAFGEQSYTYARDPDNPIELPLYSLNGNTAQYTLQYPVFLRQTQYALLIQLRETYTNVDNNDNDEVPVTDGVLSIANNWGESFFVENDERVPYPKSASGTDLIQVNNEQGEITYRFLSLSPDPSDKGNDSFTKTFQISANTGGNNTVFYPGPAQNTVAKAYVFGSKPTEGSSFITSGPDRVEFILRDPQGSNSYSYWESGSVLETEEIMRWDLGQELDVEANIGFSMTTWVGVGAGTVNTVGSTFDLFFSQSSKEGEENVRVSTVETTQRYQTSDENVGSSADVFIGKSENFTYGLSTNVYLIPEDQCGPNGELCPNPAQIELDGVIYKVGVKPGFYLSPNGEVTYFVFSQFYIEETLLPTLRQVRNNILENNADYSAVFTDTSDPQYSQKYGSNNDDPIWGGEATTSNYPKTDDADFVGNSYTFIAGSEGEIDSIRWANQQIRLWTNALRQNEEDKLKAIQEDDQLFENLSISGGNTFNFETTTSAKESREEFYELDLAFGAGKTFEFRAFNLENDLQVRPSITSSEQSRTINTETKTSTVGFELLDRDSDDLLNISVLNSQFGFGPIFRNRDGGITSCPHEPAEVTKYYEPGTQWSTGTLQSDKPRLEVEVPQVFNVPSDQAAVYTLNLFNDSETNEDVNYVMKLVDGTNRDGAVLRIDGSVLTDGREFFVPGGSAIQKTLTLERGPLKYNYEGIKIQLMSACQNDPTGFFEVIADTVSLSANFIPTCTNVAVIKPEPNFTLNNSDKVGDMRLVNINVAEYDINFSGLEKIELEFKSSESNNWTKLATYWYDTTGRGDNDTLQIPRSAPQISFLWDITSGVPDGNYDIRTLASCRVPTVFDQNNNPLTYIDVVTTSEVSSGILDTIDPHVFGAPQPSDGILSAGEEISIQFNEPINIGILQNTNFTITGELNGGNQAHPASVHFNGTENQFVEIPNPANLSRKSFSIDFYMRRNSTGEAILFSMGLDAQNEISIGFNSNDQPFFSINGEEIVSPTAITDNNWHHIAATYHHGSQNAALYIGGNRVALASDFIVDFNTTASIFLAKAQYSPSRPFDGNIHELRLWNRALLETDVSKVAVRKMDASEPGLISNWRLEDGRGTIARDIIRQKNGTISGTWQIEPSGLAYAFDGVSDVLFTNSPSFNADTDFSIEFWVNADPVSDSVTFISNGRGDAVDPNLSGWSIGTDASGFLLVRSTGGAIATSYEIDDGFWHHVALTLNRLGNVVIYANGIELVSVEASDYPGFGSPRLWIGARGWYDGLAFQTDQHFRGSIDEIRLWNLTRRVASIENDLYNKLQSNETGLARYYPLETFPAGPLSNIASPAYQNLVTGENASENTLSGGSMENFTSETPPILLPKQVQNVPFSVSANRDKVILTPQFDPARIENVILNITAKNIRDMNGNRMSSPVSWTAFVDQNTLIWDETSLTYEIEQGTGFTFQVTIRNTGGNIENFTIENLPPWLNASTTSGSLSPLSNQIINFTINPAVNTGSYLQDIILTSNSGFNERLLIGVKVKTPLPADWVVDESDFEFSMNVIGRMKIMEEFSRDADDRLAAFVNGEIRGIGVPQYFEVYDNYQVFMTIYSNDETSTEKVTYKIWNASEGRIHTGVIASDERVYTFDQQSVFGNTTNPILFEAGDDLLQSISMSSGWNWISFNLTSTELTKPNQLFGELVAEEGNIIKSILGYFDQFSTLDGWLGTISANGGFNTGELYKLRLDAPATLQYAGTIIDPTATPIPIAAGWNWVGYLPQENIAINEALAGLTHATSGDLIKSQSSFAIYDDNIGWLGSLTSLKPGEGYMMEAANAGTLTYPATGLINGRQLFDSHEALFAQWGFNPNAYADNMSIIATLAIDGDPLNLSIGAFIKDELRGVALPTALPEDGENRYFIAVAGDTGGEPITFRALLEDGTTVALIGEQTFSTNALRGSIASPVELRWPTMADELASQLDVYPNPFDASVTISLNSEVEEMGEIKILDVSGRLVRELQPEKEQKQVVWNGRGASGGQLPAGIYLMRIKVGNEVITKRVVKN